MIKTPASLLCGSSSRASTFSDVQREKRGLIVYMGNNGFVSPIKEGKKAEGKPRSAVDKKHGEIKRKKR